MFSLEEGEQDEELVSLDDGTRASHLEEKGQVPVSHRRRSTGPPTEGRRLTRERRRQRGRSKKDTRNVIFAQNFG